jgi:hypothetical protein
MHFAFNDELPKNEVGIYPKKPKCIFKFQLLIRKLKNKATVLKKRYNNETQGRGL